MELIKRYWRNFETGQDDYIETPTEENVKFYLPYIDGVPVGYQLYLAHRKLSKSHADAMLAVYNTSTRGSSDND